MSDATLATISTLAWIALVGVILGLFGRTEGGAWSIAGSVARGMRDWSGEHDQAPPVSPSPNAVTSPSASPSPPADASTLPRPEVEDLGATPLR